MLRIGKCRDRRFYADLSEEDIKFVSLLYNYILALEAEESVKERERA